MILKNGEAPVLYFYEYFQNWREREIARLSIFKLQTDLLRAENCVAVAFTMAHGKMNAVRFHGKNDLRYEEIPVPELKSGQVKNKPAWVGICGTGK